MLKTGAKDTLPFRKVKNKKAGPDGADFLLLIKGVS